jgi:hypothetical protein
LGEWSPLQYVGGIALSVLKELRHLSQLQLLLQLLQHVHRRASTSEVAKKTVLALRLSTGSFAAVYPSAQSARGMKLEAREVGAPISDAGSTAPTESVQLISYAYQDYKKS